MKNVALALSLLFLFCLSLTSHAGGIPGAMRRDTWKESATLDRYSIGVKGFAMSREVRMDDENDTESTLDAFGGCLFLGYDMNKWYTAFATLGAACAELEADDNDTSEEYGDAKLKFSLGVNGNLWQYQLKHPDFFAGRLSIRGVAEYSRFMAEDEGDDIRWSEFMVALPFGYERFVDYGPFKPEPLYSIAFFVGPGFSTLKGSRDIDKVATDFNEDTDIGAVGGFEIFFSDNFSIGADAQYFKGVQVNGGFNFHF